MFLLFATRIVSDTLVQLLIETRDSRSTRNCVDAITTVSSISQWVYLQLLVSRSNFIVNGTSENCQEHGRQQGRETRQSTVHCGTADCWRLLFVQVVSNTDMTISPPWSSPLSNLWLWCSSFRTVSVTPFDLSFSVWTSKRSHFCSSRTGNSPEGYFTPQVLLQKACNKLLSICKERKYSYFTPYFVTIQSLQKSLQWNNGYEISNSLRGLNVSANEKKGCIFLWYIYVCKSVCSFEACLVIIVQWRILELFIGV